MLEPCHHGWKANKMYGRGTDFVPENLAMPIKVLADRIGYGQLLLEYSYGYALNNWKFKNDPTPGSSMYENEWVCPDNTKSIDKIELIRKHYGCENEAGFVLVHVAIVSKTPKQIEAIRVMYEGISCGNREMFNQGLKQLNAFHDEIFAIFETMWEESMPKNYLDFRTFIMGV